MVNIIILIIKLIRFKSQWCHSTTIPISFKSINSFSIYRENKEEKCKEFFNQFEKSGNTLPSWWNPKEEDTVQGLNGKVLLLSRDENSIPFESFDFINEILNGYNLHLG